MIFKWVGSWIAARHEKSAMLRELQALRNEVHALGDQLSQPRKYLCGVNIKGVPWPTGASAWLEPGAEARSEFVVQEPIKKLQVEAWGGAIIDSVLVGTRCLSHGEFTRAAFEDCQAHPGTKIQIVFRVPRR